MTDTFLTITPLGGLGEIGMNCQMWNTSEGCVLVDCGIMFPDDQQLGVDVVIPPLEPILAQRGRLLGVVLTHGHEDHIGAVPWLVSFIKGLKVYGSPMTLALVEHKLRERGLLDRAELITVTPEHELALGGLRFHFIPVSHSIPQGYALAVDTPVGKVVHTGDFKIDEFPSDGVGTDLPALRSFAGADGVRLLLSDSTNAESEGHTQSEKVVRETFHEIFSEAKGRIVITLFSSHIERIQMVFDMAREFDRAVVVSGRSLVNNIERGRDLGFMRMPPELFTDQTIPDVSPERMVVIATGSHCVRRAPSAFHHGRRHGDHVFPRHSGQCARRQPADQPDVPHGGRCLPRRDAPCARFRPWSARRAPHHARRRTAQIFRADSRRVPPSDPAPRFGP